MRKGDYCIRNIDKLVDEGCISPERAKELEKWQEFRKQYPDLSGLSEKACRPLMRERDAEVQAKAIEKVGKAINHKGPLTGPQTVRVVKNIEEGKDTRGRPSKVPNATEIVEQGISEPDVDENTREDVETVVDDFVDLNNDDVGGVADIPDMPDTEVVEVSEEVVEEEVVEVEEVVEEEVVEDEAVLHPEITAKVTKEFLTNAGHEDVPQKTKPLPTEEAKQAIFDTCIKQAFEWGMDGDEIARRMEKAIIYLHPTSLGSEN